MWSSIIAGSVLKPVMRSTSCGFFPLAGRLVGGNLPRQIIRQSSGWNDRRQRKPWHDQGSDLQRAQTGLGIPLHRFRDLLRRSAGAFHHAPQPVVADEGDVVEVDLAL